MTTNIMASVNHRLHLRRKIPDEISGKKEIAFDVVLLEQVKDAVGAICKIMSGKKETYFGLGCVPADNGAPGIGCIMEEGISGSQHNRQMFR